MTETAKKPAKPKAEKAPAKAAEPKAAKKAEKPAASGKTIKVTQVQGSIARKWDQEATLRGLGLGKRHRSRVLQDTPEIRGMVYKVRHLVKVENQ
ncbi:MAG: 50S ribosomal protein L30 [Pseudomonadota bacterium]|nr:50S ribosomal protein L30 [Pseudomonadota bacterium]